MQHYFARVNFNNEVEHKMNHTLWVNWCADRTFTGLITLVENLKNCELQGTVEYLRLCSLRMRVMTEKLNMYQAMRGGQGFCEQYKPIFDLPTQLNQQQPLKHVLEMVMEIEKRVEFQYRELHAVANKFGDCVTVEMLESKFIPAQLKMIRVNAGFLNTIVQCNEQGVIFDRMTLIPVVQQICYNLVKRAMEPTAVTVIPECVLFFLAKTVLKKMNNFNNMENLTERYPIIENFFLF